MVLTRVADLKASRWAMSARYLVYLERGRLSLMMKGIQSVCQQLIKRYFLFLLLRRAVLVEESIRVGAGTLDLAGFS